MNPEIEYFFLKDIIYNEKINEEEVRSTLKEPLLHYRRCIDLFLKIFLETINQKDLPERSSVQNNAKFAIITIMFRLVGTLQSIRVLEVKGYYFESGMLSRNLYESLGLSVFLKTHPEKADKWLDGEQVITTRDAFTLTTKIFNVDRNQGIDKLAIDSYHILCSFVHGKAIANIYSIVNNNDGKHSFQLPSTLRNSEVADLWILSLAMLYALWFLFEDDIKSNQTLRLGEFILREFSEYQKYKSSMKP